MARRRAEQSRGREERKGERGGNARNRVGERERNECVPSRHSPPLPPSPSIISGYIPSSQGIKVRFPRRPEIMRPFAEGSGNETRILSRFVSLTRPRPSKHFYPSPLALYLQARWLASSPSSPCETTFKDREGGGTEGGDDSSFQFSSLARLFSPVSPFSKREREKKISQSPRKRRVLVAGSNRMERLTWMMVVVVDGFNEVAEFASHCYW